MTNSYQAALDLRVTSSGLSQAGKGLKQIEEQGGKTERATDGVGNAFKRVLAPIAAFVSVTAGLKKVTEVTRQFEIFKASLETATGSAQKAQVAFEALEDFATRTPYQLEQSVEAFVKLTNLGLKPSERALTSFGDTAAAMGKDLNQFIEAVADATTNEFERLKEFGIKASQEGDRVSFTFRGMTTTVGKNADEIQEYLTALGENNFAGAMERRMDTLDGALSNLGDTWDSLFRTIGDQGLGDLIEEGVRNATNALAELESMLESGQIEQSAKVIGSLFEGYGRDIASTLDIVNEIFQKHAERIGAEGQELAEFLTQSISELPANVRAFIQIMTVELASFIDKTSAYGTEILENLKFWEDETFDLETELSKIDQVRLSSIDTILKERDTAVTATEQQIQKVASLREEYDKLNASKTVSIDDVNDGDTPSTPKGPSAQSVKDFESLIDKVIPPTDKINRVFEKRLALIRENTEAGSEQQAELIKRLNENYRDEILDGFDDPGEYDYTAKIDLVNEEYQARREAILGNIELTENQRTELEVTLAKGRAVQLEAIEKQRWSSQLGVAKGALGNLSTLMNSESRKAFKIGKIAAIANATISGIEAVVHSYKFGSQIGGPILGAAFAATAAAATAVQIQQIKSQQFGGGGTVSPGGGGSAPPNVYQPPQPTQPVGPSTSQNGSQGSPSVILNINGPVTGGVQTFAEELRDYLSLSDFVLVENTSRNGEQLRT